MEEKEPYDEYYKKRDHIQVYPVEFVVRTLLGTYPNLKMNRESYRGSNLLDIGYGDGRNMPLFQNQGFKIYGTEITAQINELGKERLQKLGVDAELKVGHNNSLPYEDGFFDFVSACHSCYYVQEGTTFNDNLVEITRVMKKGGVFFASLPMSDNFIFKSAEPLEDGHYRIVDDPYGIRNGTIHKTFATKEELKNTFSDAFSNISIGHINDDYFGINVRMWIIKAEKK